MEKWIFDQDMKVLKSGGKETLMSFGMGINRPNICRIVRFRVPQNICSYAQKIECAGRDGNSARANIFYSNTKIENGGTWIKGHLYNPHHCSRILRHHGSTLCQMW